MAEPDTCDAAIRPFPDKHVELKCEVLTGTHTQHKHELKDYAYPGSRTVIHWFESDRHNYHGEYPGQCGTVIGCQLLSVTPESTRRNGPSENPSVVQLVEAVESLGEGQLQRTVPRLFRDQGRSRASRTSVQKASRMNTNEHTRELLHFWLTLERHQYADKKFAEDTEGRKNLLAAMHAGEWTIWTDFAHNYISRAELFGLDTEKGRQALGKAIVTLMHTLETAMEVHGPLPKPGVTSGEIEEWIRQ